VAVREQSDRVTAYITKDLFEGYSPASAPLPYRHPCRIYESNMTARVGPPNAGFFSLVTVGLGGRTGSARSPSGNAEPTCRVCRVLQACLPRRVRDAFHTAERKEALARFREGRDRMRNDFETGRPASLHHR
jgi:hypothetical protein